MCERVEEEACEYLLDESERRPVILLVIGMNLRFVDCTKAWATVVSSASSGFSLAMYDPRFIRMAVRER
uniref:Polyketide synthase n=1 Tax=Peronospora matthiolae TaxID=2874970 RepID=A0AAV1VBL9_9STRA